MTEHRGATWMRNFSILIVLATITHCSPGYEEVELSLLDLPADAKHVWFERAPQGESHRSQFFLNPDQIRDRVRLRLTGQLGSSETVRVRALDESFCRLAAGEVQLTTGQATAEVMLASQRELGCLLRVSTTGPGKVKVADCLLSSPSGPQSTDYHLKSGFLDPRCTGMRQLEAEPEDSAYFAGWSGACEGGAPCDPWPTAIPSIDPAQGTAADLVADGLTEVHAAFAPRRACTSSGFCWVNPAPHGFALFGIWGSAPNDIWAVGEAGTVMRYNGTAWVTLPSQDVGSDADFAGIWGSSRNDIWIVGQKGALSHWNGQIFTHSTLDPPVALNAVWGVGPDEVYVAGSGGNAFRCNAQQQCKLLPAAPGTDLTGVALIAIWGRSGTEVYLAGSRLRSDSGGILNNLYGGVLLRWDGLSLSRVYTMEPPNSVRFSALTGRTSGPRQLWIGTSDGGVLSGDGEHFQVETATDSGRIYALTTTGPALDNEQADVWAATARGQLLHRTALGWEQLSTTAYESLFALYGDRVNLWAVGDSGSIINWNGAEAVSVTSGKRALALGRWLDSSGELWLSWEDRIVSQTAQRSSLIVRDDTQTFFLLGLHGFGSSLFAASVGGIVMRGPTGWTGLPTTAEVSSVPFNALAGLSPDDLWAVGQQASLLHNTAGFASSTSRQLQIASLIKNQIQAQNRQPESFDLAIRTSPADAVQEVEKNTFLNAVWVARADSMFAAGEAGAIVKWDGTAFSEQLMPYKDRLPTYNAIWGSSPTDGWMAGTSGAVLRYDGQSWQPCAGPACPTDSNRVVFFDIAGTGPNDVWLVGGCESADCSNVYHWDGNQFCHVLGLPNIIRWVATRGNEVFLVGATGSILHLGDTERKALRCIR